MQMKCLGMEVRVQNLAPSETCCDRGKGASPAYLLQPKASVPPIFCTALPHGSSIGVLPHNPLSLD